MEQLSSDNPNDMTLASTWSACLLASHVLALILCISIIVLNKYLLAQKPSTQQRIEIPSKTKTRLDLNFPTLL